MEAALVTGVRAWVAATPVPVQARSDLPLYLAYFLAIRTARGETHLWRGALLLPNTARLDHAALAILSITSPARENGTATAPT